MSKSSPTPSFPNHNIDPNYITLQPQAWCPYIIQLFENAEGDYDHYHQQEGPRAAGGPSHSNHLHPGEHEEVDIQSVLDIIDSVLRTVEDVVALEEEEEEEEQQEEDLPPPRLQ
eukprot:Nitzschia sp. Nitz4//scaffold50_size126154//20161//20502//NITZ4_003672-RA/size126154-processed-gene-0.30-mRNA-1//1//CDS//3329553659//7763//frame0